MEILQLHYFKELAKREHLTRTADELRVSAPSLSATISRLEAELNVKLFDRVGRNIRLNECGRTYLKHVKDIFSILENAKLEVIDIKNGQQESHLSLAITSPIIWLDAFQAFVKENPHISISHTIVKMDMLENNSCSSQFDFYITAANDLKGDEWDSEILCPDDKPYFAVYKDHPFAKRKSVRFIEAKNEKFIALSKGFSSRKFFDDLCDAEGLTPKIIIECDYILRTKLVAAEYGITLSTETAYKTGALADMVFVEILDPKLRRVQSIIWNKRRYISKSAVAFKNFMVNYYCCKN